MIIDIFKDPSWYAGLEKYNKVIGNAYNQFDFKIKKSSTDYWFRPGRVASLPLIDNWPKPNPLTKDKKFSLILYAPNYVTLFLANVLYQDKKDVLIEDVCCGMGRLIFYLSKCGFNNFSLVDDFSQLPKGLMVSLMDSEKIKYVLNEKDTKPSLVNIVGYPHFIKPFPLSTELFCAYPNIRLTFWTMNEILTQGYRILGKDRNELMLFYCKESKYKEFYEKLERYKIH